MRCNPTLFQIMAASVISLTSMSSHADITKCVDRDGRISYISEGAGACNELDTVSHLVTTTPEQPVVEVAPRVVSRAALENTIIRETSWAQAPATLHRSRTDVSTVMEARANLQAMDRALASMRTQKVASSH